jgi:hypothetical protein
MVLKQLNKPLTDYTSRAENAYAIFVIHKSEVSTICVSRWDKALFKR